MDLPLQMEVFAHLLSFSVFLFSCSLCSYILLFMLFYFIFALFCYIPYYLLRCKEALITHLTSDILCAGPRGTTSVRPAASVRSAASIRPAASIWPAVSVWPTSIRGHFFASNL